jgi:hypothetical protein
MRAPFSFGRSAPALDVGGMAPLGMAPLTTLVSLALVVLAAAQVLHQPIPPPLPPPPTRRRHIHRHMRALAHARAFARMHSRTHTPTAPVRPHTVIYMCAADLPRFHSTHPQSGRINMETYVQRVLRGGRMLGKTKAFSLVKDVADVDAIARHFDVTIKEVPPSDSGFEAEFGSS